MAKQYRRTAVQIAVHGPLARAGLIRVVTQAGLGFAGLSDKPDIIFSNDVHFAFIPNNTHPSGGPIGPRRYRRRDAPGCIDLDSTAGTKESRGLAAVATDDHIRDDRADALADLAAEGTLHSLADAGHCGPVDGDGAT